MAKSGARSGPAERSSPRQGSGYVAHCLELAGRAEIPLAAGSEVSMTMLARAEPIIDDERHWPGTLACRPAPPGAAVDLLYRSIEQGATVVAIGPFTNLALLEMMRPGSLDRVPAVAVAGWFEQRGGVLRFEPEPAGNPTRVVVDLDRVEFSETWLTAVEAVPSLAGQRHPRA